MPNLKILEDTILAETEEAIWYDEPISRKQIKHHGLSDLTSCYVVNKNTGVKGLVLLKNNNYLKEFKDVESLLCYIDIESMSRKTLDNKFKKPKRSTNKYAGLRG